MPSTLRKVLLSLCILLLLGLAHGGWLDAAGREYTEAGFKRALVTFGIARGLNGVISVAQGTEVAFQPAGVGVNFAPGQILDPVNDLIERFSWVMLVSSTSLGLQRVLLDMTAWDGSTWLVTLLGGLALIFLWWRPRRAGDWPRRLLQLALLLLVVRFTIPMIALAGEGMYGLFLQQRYAVSTAELEQSTERIGRINEATRQRLEQEGSPGLLDQARRAYDSMVGSLDLEARTAELRATVTRVSEHTIDLIVVFVLQTVILPLLFLWLLVKLARGVGNWLWPA
ncbi:hypothetical protein [Thiohalobacter thiocyanaticus]|uniref:Uncharacterized protein n=1 Tax=Thiohalobacter thiocyanaticus TaxID=585455 RepID=A0A426QGV4_9GAMM|nr:hypothetical protein [Thiohalobacter thiocyanaticus]RRQ20982.1 hypothetical protein D6C00_02675 [Thiohalobacter thiocyanaticus]